jgi:hypothetical protein
MEQKVKFLAEANTGLIKAIKQYRNSLIKPLEATHGLESDKKNPRNLRTTVYTCTLSKGGGE